MGTANSRRVSSSTTAYSCMLAWKQTVELCWYLLMNFPNFKIACCSCR